MEPQSQPGDMTQLEQAVVLVLLAAAALADVNVMKDVTLGFGQALDKCRQESDLTEEKMEEFFHFWREDFKFEHRELGCAIQCMSNHFNLLTDSSRMHHSNTEEFIQSFPNVMQYDMLIKVLVLALALSAASAQLELGVLAELYYPRPRAPVDHTLSTQPPRHPGPRPADYGRRRVSRSYFDRDAAPPTEGNDAELRRALPHMVDPHWTPVVRPRAPWFT